MKCETCGHDGDVALTLKEKIENLKYQPWSLAWRQAVEGILVELEARQPRPVYPSLPTPSPWPNWGTTPNTIGDAPWPNGTIVCRNSEGKTPYPIATASAESDATGYAGPDPVGSIKGIDPGR